MHPLRGAIDATCEKQPPPKKRPASMDATANFSLRFTRASESKVQTNDQVLSRQTLQRISTRISLISLTLGFWVFAVLIFINRHQAELNGLSGGSAVA